MYFLVRHTPFWAIPICLIAMEFGYVFWLKDNARTAFMFFGVAGFTSLFVMYYYWAGGPEKSVDHFIRLIHGQ